MKSLSPRLGPAGCHWVLSSGDARINLISLAGLNPGRFRGGPEKSLMDEMPSLSPRPDLTWCLLTKWPDLGSSKSSCRAPGRRLHRGGLSEVSLGYLPTRRKQLLPLLTPLWATPAHLSSGAWEQPFCSAPEEKPHEGGFAVPLCGCVRCPCVGVCSLQWLWVFFSLSFSLSDCLAWILTTFTTVPPDSQGSPESRTGRNLSYAMPDGEVSRGRPRTLITGRGVRTQVSRLSPTPAFRQLWTCPSLPYGISWLPKAWGHSPPKHTLCVSVGMALPPYSVASSSIHSVNVSWVSLKEMGHIGGLEAWERSAQIGVDSGKGAGGVRPVRRGFSIQGRKCESLK